MTSDRPVRVLYVLPDGPVMGGMTMITRMFQQAGVFNNPCIHHFNSYFSWGEAGMARLAQALWLKVMFVIALRRNRIDAVFVMTSSYWGFYDKMAYCLIARALGKKVILNPVGGHFSRFAGATRVSRWLVPRLLRIPHLVGTATSFWVDYYTTTFGLRRVVVMPNPVLFNADLPPRLVSDRVLQVLFLTRLEVEKGAWEFVGAIEQCLAAGFTIRFVVAGDGSLLEEVRTRLAPYMSTGLVHVHGWVTEEEKERLFLESDVYVLPTYVEVLSVAMLQAMSHRLAVIVTDVCGNSDAVQNGVSGWLVPPQNVSQIADGIVRLDRDRPLLARMANTAFEKCRQTYSLDAVLAQHREAFRRLISPTPMEETRPSQP